MNPLQNTPSLERALIHRAKNSQLPINGSMELLPLCNMRCNMCYVRMDKEELDKKGKLLSASKWLDIGKQMKEAGTLLLLLTGGEPLLYPEFKELYCGLKELGMLLTVNTNGTLINDAWADFFAENTPRRINITLYGASNETYEKLCHYPNGFDKTLSGIKRLKARNLDVQITCSLTPDNEADLEKIVEIAKELDCPTAFEDYMIPARKDRNQPSDPHSRLTPLEAARVTLRVNKSNATESQMREYVRAKIIAVDSRAESSHSENTQALTCMAGSCSYTINWQGNMRPCVSTNTPSISVLEHGFSASWEYVKKESSKLCLNEKCVLCKYRPICRTCAVSAYLETGDFQGVPEYLCQYSEELYRLMKEYLR